jgi:anti-sigma factor RsiW
MRCQRARRRLSAYLDDELDRRQRADLEAHLEHCRSCTALVADRRDEWAALADMDPVPSMPADTWARVTSAVEEADRLPWYRQRQAQLIRAVCVTAAVVRGITGGVVLSGRKRAASAAHSEVSVRETMLVTEAFDATAFGLSEDEEGLLQCVPR